METRVRAFRLVNGDVLVAEDLRIETTDEEIITHNPAIVFLKQNGDKTDGVMTPYMPFSIDGRVTIYKKNIAAECVPAPRLADEYKRLFENGFDVMPPEAEVVKHTVTEDDLAEAAKETIQ